MKGDIVAAVRMMKNEPGPGMVILGSGTIVSQLTQAGLIDEYQTKTRVFGNGDVVLWYEPKA